MSLVNAQAVEDCTNAVSYLRFASRFLIHELQTVQVQICSYFVVWMLCLEVR